ncbi:popeye domain-containing 2 isoform X2 [Clupea harengus]|uniref:Popeye domain-containing 2 isoform X2 n=1 Tax=Clupea harengus TaxID=7950 RepID=A0A6P3WFN7_CLUHA|nr:popeye domain-containing 2 isoform X2 [Clupea harengus]
MSGDNSTLLNTVLYGHQQCDGFTNTTEGALYHLGNTVLILGYMGGSGAYGALYIFSLLVPAYVCLALWGFVTICGLDAFVWYVLMVAACLCQICHLVVRLLRDGLASEELSAVYTAVFVPLGVPVQVFKQITGSCENKVLALGTEETYAVEGKTPIDQLSFLLSGRIRVSLEGQFLHYIFPHQFLDSPEWESLRPTEEGNFQVTLTAETDCRYISWSRRRLYLLLSRERYVARLFSVMLGNDIADKLYSLNDKLFAKSGVRLDIRLPSLYHVLAPSAQASERGSGSSSSAPPFGSHGDQAVVTVDPLPDTQKPKSESAPQERGRAPAVGPSTRQQSCPSDTELPSEGDTSGVPPARYQRGRAPLAPTDTPKL